MGLVLAGCFNRTEVPYLGRWTGRFVVESVDPKQPIHDPGRNGLHGSIQLYRTENRCAMHLEGEQEAIDVSGTWALRGRQIVLRFNKLVSMDDAGGIDLRDPNRAFIPTADLKATVSTPLGLNVGSGGKRLTSPAVQIGPLLGHYEFSKDSLGH